MRWAKSLHSLKVQRGRRGGIVGVVIVENEGMREIGIGEVVEVFVYRLSCFVLAVFNGANAFADDSWMPNWGSKKAKRHTVMESFNAECLSMDRSKGE